MKIKVCGIRTKQNLAYLNQSAVDFIGFIFYDKSKRNFAGGDLTTSDMLDCQKSKVGVFVDEEIDTVEEIVKQYQLDYVQLHGHESVDYCKELKDKGFGIIKAFSIDHTLPDDLSAYEAAVDFYLFDTKGKLQGGNGVQFDWAVLDSYKGKKPFLLSGGIGPEDVEQVKSFEHASFYSLDINSKFEIEPGLKDEQLLEKFIKEI